MNEPTPSAAPPTSAHFVRVDSPEEYQSRDLSSRRYGCRESIQDSRRGIVIVSILLAAIAALTFTGHSAVVTGAILTILSCCLVALIVGLVSVHRELREIEAKLREAERPPA